MNMNFLVEMFRALFAPFFSGPAQSTIHVLYLTSPFWLPISLAFAFWHIWIDYVRSKFITSQKYILLELKLPADVFKSPMAMELVLSGLFVTGGESTWYDKYILGKVRTWFSFEIASINGNIHFYVWTRAAFKNLIEAQFYGQYPNIEIHEVPDYTTSFPKYDKETMNMFGFDIKLEKPDPYPIKTYIDYGLDKDPKEEYKIDPITPMLEYFSTIGQGEEMWIQYEVRAHKKKRKGSALFESTTWQDEAKELVQTLRKEWLSTEKTVTDGSTITFERIPTKIEMETLAAIERSATKLGFDVGGRAIYLGKKDTFNGAKIASFTNILRAFQTNNLNSLSLTNTTSFDYPWEDFFDIRADYLKKKMLSAYRRRSYFHPPYRRNPFVLNQEELATVWHLPGKTLVTPSAARVTTRRAAAPTNLPL